MGVFQSKDSLSELKVRFIDRGPRTDEAVKQIVINMGLLLCPRNKHPNKQKRITNGGPMLFKSQQSEPPIIFSQQFPPARSERIWQTRVRKGVV